MRLRSVLAITTAGLILAACGSGGGNITVGDGGSKNLGEKELERLFTKFSYRCEAGSNTIRFAAFDETNRPLGNTIFEISNTSFTVVEHELTAAEKLNGYEFKGHIVFDEETATRFLKPQQSWSDWGVISTNGMGGMPRNNLHLKDEKWELIGADWIDKGWGPMRSLFTSDREYIFHRNICD